MHIHSLLIIVLLDFIKNHKSLCVLIAILQIISTLAVFFIFALNVASNEENKQNSIKSSIFEIGVSNVPKNVLESKLQQISNQFGNDLDFIQAVDIKNKCSYEYLYKARRLYLGYYFPRKEFNEGKNVIIASYSNDPDAYIGKTIMMYEQDYSVIGVTFGENRLLSYSNLKYTNAKINTLILRFSRVPSIRQIDEYQKFLKQLFPNNMINPPESEASEFLPDMTTTVLIIGFFILSLINISFVYCYLLSKRNTHIKAMHVCGANNRQIKKLYVSEMFIFSTVVYIISAVLSNFLIPSLTAFATTNNWNVYLKVWDYITLFLFYIIITTTIFWISINQYLKLKV